MSKAILMNFVADKANKKIKVDRPFNAELDLVWAAWTQSEILDQWWAPKPWKAVTKSQDFSEGGRWLYYMAGPEGEKHWCTCQYRNIKPQTEFSYHDNFCDENGNINTSHPSMDWHIGFTDNGDTTMVNIVISFDKLEDLETITQMGFKEGFSMGMENLDNYLNTKFKLRKENKQSNAARVTTYLNFPGNTEEAMNFYKEVFKGEFVGKGLQRFSDVEMPAEHPPMSEEDKKLIIHAELSILGGHIIMATDAPESMGFKMIHGNNMHINVEPDSREETERLFKALSEGGVVDAPLQDMPFFGAYYGALKDKYGINWMLNYQLANEA